MEKFAVSDEKLLREVIDAYPFATVVSVAGGIPSVNHLPVIAETLPSGELRLLGHLSRRNPQWEQLQAGAALTIVFHGPHAYVNPGWYERNDVPSWNYVAVHAEGQPTLVEDHAGLIRILRKTAEHMNRIHPDQWDFYLPPDLEPEEFLTSAIAGFELLPTEFFGKFKLGQNRSAADQLGMIEGLKARPDESSRRLAGWLATFQGRS
jgi:transcriptional regulator